MNPLYFPFTYISEATATALQRIFGKVTVYQASSTGIPNQLKRLADNERIELKIPVKGEENKIHALLNEFKTWAELHSAKDFSFFKTRQSSIPFFNETSVSRIRSDIKDSMKPAPASENDPLMSCRIFLHFAQEYDEQKSELIQNLASHESMRKDLFANLTGDDTRLPESITDPDDFPDADSGSFMTSERMEALARLFANDADRLGFDMLITTSREVMDHIRKKVPALEQVLSLNNIESNQNLFSRDCPAEGNDLANWIEHLAVHGHLPRNVPFSDPQPLAEKGNKGSMTIFIAQNTSPTDFIARFTDEPVIDSGADQSPRSVTNALVVFIDL